MSIAIALAGNPNAGKTTLFNELTGARQQVGNYPGVTVEKKQGTCVSEAGTFEIIDLPGTYSLTAYSLEEVVARDYLVNEKPAMVVNIVDASNLERNLYLSVQFMEMGIPVCLALNMMDVAQKRGIEIDVDRLSELLGVPVVPMVARTGKGKKDLLAQVAKGINKPASPLLISYGQDIDKALDKMEAIIEENHFLTEIYPARWVGLKYFENDAQILELGADRDKETAGKLMDIGKKLHRHMSVTLDTHPEAMIADQRYGFINSVLKQNVIRFAHDRNRLQRSDQIDKVLTNRFLGPLIMVGVLAAMYQFTFTYSALPVEWVGGIFSWISGVTDAALPDGLLKSMIVSGIIDGVGGVMGFVPLIMFMFLGISFIEDSGYLARMAFMLDRVFRIFGLHGSSVMAFIISGGIAGGCAVPGVMAARTLKSPRERLATLLTVPFMNCGAKLPVYALLVAAFFPKKQAMIMVILTLISWIGALLVAKLLRSTVIRGEATPFVMELPPYRFPTLKGLLIHTWERTWQYMKKAGTVILGISILIWAMMTFPGLDDKTTAQFESQRTAITDSVPADVLKEIESADKYTELSSEAREVKDALAGIDGRQALSRLENSLAGRIGKTLEKISYLAGFDWRTNIALVGGFAAKEVVVSTLGTAYSLGDVDSENSMSLAKRLAQAPGWGPVTAFALMIFTIFYAPCFVTVVCISRETGSWKWAAFSVVFNTTLAFALSVLTYQVGSLLVN